VKLKAYIITIELRGEYTIPAAIVATTGTVQLNFLNGSTIRLYFKLGINLFGIFNFCFQEKGKETKGICRI
jgi:hypothetical protein